MRRRRLGPFGVAAMTLTGVMTTAISSADGAMVSIAPTMDNTIYEEPLFNGDLRSNGKGSYIFAGNTAGNDSRRALLHFDVASAVPEGAVIQSVSLQLRMSMTIAGPTDVSLHRADASWGEGESKNDITSGQGIAAQSGDATWEHRFFDTFSWQMDGGDFAGIPSATTSVGGTGFYTWGGDRLLADITAWLGDPSSNFGWILIGNEFSATTAKRFDSKDHATEANRPKLTIVFEIPIVLGDMNGDGVLDAFDVAPFELALADLDAYTAAFPGLDPIALGDINGDASLDAFDVNPFEVELASAGGSIPEPGAGALLLLGLAGLGGRLERFGPRRN